MPVLNYVASAGLSTIADGQSATITVPAGGTQDVAILVVVTNCSATASTPSGWTLATSNTTSTTRRGWVYWRAITTAGSFSVGVSMSRYLDSFESGETAEIVVHRFTGAGPPYVAEANNAYNSGSSTSTPFSSLSIAAGNTSLLVGYNSTTGHTQPAGWSEHYDSGRHWVASREYLSATSTGLVNVTHSSASQRLSFHLELQGLAISYVGLDGPGGFVQLGGAHAPGNVLRGEVYVTTTPPPAATVFPPDGLPRGAVSVAPGTISAPVTARTPVGVLRGDVFATPGGFVASQNQVFQPGVSPLGVGVNPGFLQIGTFHQPGVFLGYALWPEEWHSQTIVWEDHAVRPGEVRVGAFPAIPTTTALYQPAAAQVVTGLAFLAPGTIVRPQQLVGLTVLPFLEGRALGVHDPQVGQYLLLTEPDEAVWGASGGFSARVDFLDLAGETIASTASKGSNIVLVSGGVDEDCTQGVMRSVSLRLLLVPSEDGTRHPLLPSKPGDPLDPRSGARMAVYAGPLRPSGLPAWVKLGVFAITNVTATSAGVGDSLTIKGMSLESEIAAAKFYRVTTIANGTRITDAILQLVREAIPDVVAVVESSPITTTELSYTDTNDRLKVIQELARSIGYKCYFDREGRFRLHRRMVYGEAADMMPRFSFTEGSRATVRDVSRELDASEAYNGVIVVGEPVDTNAKPVRAELWDTNPNSPTYYDPNRPGAGRRGPRPKKVVSPLVRTTEQAQAAAAALLAEVLTWVDRISVDFAANPSVECEDIVHITRSSMGVSGVYEVEHIKHDLLGGKSTAVCIARG